jgi:hypothetical protein
MLGPRDGSGPEKHRFGADPMVVLERTPVKKTPWVRFVFRDAAVGGSRRKAHLTATARQLRASRTTHGFLRFVDMTHDAFDTPFEARLVEGEIVITGPDGFNGSMTIEAARASMASLQSALDGAGGPGEIYQKPLG